MITGLLILSLIMVGVYYATSKGFVTNLFFFTWLVEVVYFGTNGIAVLAISLTAMFLNIVGEEIYYFFSDMFDDAKTVWHNLRHW